jgi:hypothetical protein
MWPVTHYASFTKRDGAPVSPSTSLSPFDLALGGLLIITFLIATVTYVIYGRCKLKKIRAADLEHANAHDLHIVSQDIENLFEEAPLHSEVGDLGLGLGTRDQLPLYEVAEIQPPAYDIVRPGVLIIEAAVQVVPFEVDLGDPPRDYIWNLLD